MDWRWTARRLVVSAFLVVHISATVLWVMPDCALQRRTNRFVRCYIFPLGLWQFWTMFAPDPMTLSYTLEAEAVDTQGIRYSFAFPRLEGYSPLERIPRFRHPKYAVNLSINEFREPREFAARHVARTLGLTADRYPVDVRLFYEFRDSPPPGGPRPDPMAAPRTSTLGTFHIASYVEAHP